MTGRRELAVMVSLAIAAPGCQLIAGLDDPLPEGGAAADAGPRLDAPVDSTVLVDTGAVGDDRGAGGDTGHADVGARDTGTMLHLDGATDHAVGADAGDTGVDASETGSADTGPSSITLVAHTIANHQNSGVTTRAIDTTGASLIVLAECTVSSTTLPTPQDSQNNVWQTGLMAFGEVSKAGELKLFYSFAPTTGATHTFTSSGSDLSMAVLAFSGTLASGGVLDAYYGGFMVGGGPTLQPGMLTPSEDGELVVSFACSGDHASTGITIDTLTLVDPLDNGTAEDMGSAYGLFDTSMVAAPTWTLTGDPDLVAFLASFRHR